MLKGKIVLLRFVLLLLFSKAAFADSSMEKNLYVFLQKVKENSLAIKISAARESERLAQDSLSLIPLEGRGSAKLALLESKPPPQGAFSLDSNTNLEAGASYEKLWQSGISTGVGYSMAHSKIESSMFGSRTGYTPDLFVSLKANLFTDVLSQRLNLLADLSKQNKKSIKSDKKQADKRVYVGSLLSLARILEGEDELFLQKKLCEKVASQTNTLRVKYKRGSINKRDFLQSKMELLQCKSSLKSLKKRLRIAKEGLASEYGVSFKDAGMKDIEKLFLAIKGIYEALSTQQKSFQVEKNSEIQALRQRQRLSSLILQEKRAHKRPQLMLDLRAGIKGYDDSIGDSFTSFQKADYPYVSASATYQFKEKDREATAKLLMARHQLEALSHEIDYEINRKNSRLKVVSESLKKDFGIYADRLKSVSLAGEVLKIAERDFKNGRLDFYALSEFQKRVLESRRLLASVRTDIIINTIEYSDFFNYFDKIL